MAGKRWSKEEELFLIENANKYSAKELSLMIGRGYDSIVKRISHLGIKDIKHSKSKKRYTYDKEYFKEIDSEEKAYWLGFIASDGCIVDKGDGSKRLKITLKEDDKSHLEKFNNCLCGNLPVYERSIKVNGSQYKTSEFVVNCTSMCKDIINLGIGHNKTLDLRMPKIDFKYIKDFIRGFIDGDGNIYIGKSKKRMRYAIEIVGYKSGILNDINDYFIEEGISSKVYFKRKDNDKLGVYEKKSIDNLVNLIYVGASMYLDRKFDKAMEILDSNFSDFNVPTISETI